MIHTLKMNLLSEQEPFSAFEMQPRFVILTKCSFPPNRNKSRSRRACPDFWSAFLETSIQCSFSWQVLRNPGRAGELVTKNTGSCLWPSPILHIWAPMGRCFIGGRAELAAHINSSLLSSLDTFIWIAQWLGRFGNGRFAKERPQNGLPK